MLTQGHSFHRFVALVFLIAACGSGGGGRETEFCERAGKLCAEGDFTAKDVRECSKELPELKKSLGKQYDKLLRCGIGAKSCGELVGCAGGAFALFAEKFGNEIETGFDKMVPSGIAGDTADEDLPRECKRVSEVCSGDDQFGARHECVRMVGNLKADPDNRKKLGACTAVAKNCYEFKDCATQLWFDLN